MPANDNASINSDRYPLKDVVICSTSVPQDVRIKLADAAQEMGASHQLDLTGNVTHLLIGATNTEKYKYVARERPDVSVLHPDWVQAVKEAWMSDDPIDLAVLEEKYRYPTFAGLRICVTGITDPDERNRVASLVQENGAEYHGDLTKQVSHLIVARPHGAKYVAMRNWKLPTVSVKWLEDSVRRRMALEAKYYDPTMPVEEQGVGAFKKEMKTRTSLGKRLREEDTRSSVDGDLGKRKLRRTASRRLEGNSQGMWQDISAGDIRAEPKKIDEWNADDQQSERNTRQDEARSGNDRPSTADRSKEAPTESTETQGLFAGWHVFVKGFERNKAEKLAAFLQSNGAKLVRQELDLEDASTIPYFKGRCICVPHAQSIRSLGLDGAPAGTVIATEWWVERCIHYKRFIDPQEDILSQALGDVSALDLSSMTISVSGFMGVEYRQAAEAIQLTGAKLADRVSSEVSLLVSGGTTVRREKAMYAAKYGIAVVSAEWLWETLRARNKADVDRYKLALPAADQLGSFGEPGTSSPAPSDMMKSSHANARKDTQPLARLSNVRKRHATPTLALKASRPVQPVAPRPSGPFVHEDDDEDDGPVAPTTTEDSINHPVLLPSISQPQPLTDISPNASPRKPQPLTAVDDSFTKPAKPSPPPTADCNTHEPKSVSAPKKTAPPLVPAEQAPQTQPDYAASLASIMSHRSVGSRPGTSNSTPEPLPQRQKPRKLGRAASNSNLTNRSSLTGTDLSTTMDRYDVDEGEDASPAPEQQNQPPSTQLGYETLESEAARLMMAKRLGTSIGDESGGTRLKSLGTVKDSPSGGGVGRTKSGRRSGK